jgi:hypothetical protein
LNKETAEKAASRCGSSTVRDDVVTVDARERLREKPVRTQAQARDKRRGSADVELD